MMARHPCPLSRLSRAVVRSRAHDPLNVGFGCRFYPEWMPGYMGYFSWGVKGPPQLLVVSRANGL